MNENEEDQRTQLKIFFVSTHPSLHIHFTQSKAKNSLGICIPNYHFNYVDAYSHLISSPRDDQS